MSSPAIDRIRTSTGRLLSHFGYDTQVQKYEAVRDLVAGTQTLQAVGEPIDVSVSWDDKVTEIAEGIQRTMRVLLVEITPELVAAGGLSEDRWQVKDPGGRWRAIEDAPLSADGTYYEAEVEGGSWL